MYLADNKISFSSSWWYTLFLKCHHEEENLKPSWQPTLWRQVCPHPFCPSYRQFTRVVALGLLGLFSWCILYAIIGEHASPPNGRVYQLILLSISAHFGGWIVSLTTLPALVGMLSTGLIFQNANVININESFTHIIDELR